MRQWLCVEKTREIWLDDNVRIHLDEVVNLGTFIEFEAMVTPACDVAKAKVKIARLMEQFGPVLGEPVAVSYCDLMAQSEMVDQGDASSM